MKSNQTKKTIDPHWVAKNREKKANAIIQTLSHFSHIQLKKTDWLDIGCGSGGISETIAPQVASITGLDLESWEKWESFQKRHKNLYFYAE